MTTSSLVGRRIIVVGTTGSGKSTLAAQLAARMRCPHIVVDGLFWQKNWTGTEPEVFRERVQQAISGDRWVIDGDYSAVRDLVWDAADTVIWLDYPLPVILWRLLRRTVRRVFLREELWNGNRETFVNAFLSWDSILLWALKTYWRNRRRYSLLSQQQEHAHIKVVHLRSPGETARWVGEIGQVTSTGDESPNG